MVYMCRQKGKLKNKENDIEILKDVAQTLENDSDLELFYQTIQSDINQIKTLQNNLKTWDKAYETSKYITLIDWPRKRIKSEINLQNIV